VPTRVLVRLGAALLTAIASVALAYLLIVYVGGALLSGAVSALFLVPRAVIWLFLALQEGADGWAIAGRIAASVADVLATRQVALPLIGLELVGAAALYALQRLLRSEVRQSKEAKQ
jgi:hypothetical protein